MSSLQIDWNGQEWLVNGVPAQYGEALFHWDSADADWTQRAHFKMTRLALGADRESDPERRDS